MTREEIVALLMRENPSVDRGVLTQYADTFLLYLEASANITEKGAVCAHPRTAEPIENPYLRVQDQMQRRFGQWKYLRTGRLWETTSPTPSEE